VLPSNPPEWSIEHYIEKHRDGGEGGKRHREGQGEVCAAVKYKDKTHERKSVVNSWDWALERGASAFTTYHPEQNGATRESQRREVLGKGGGCGKSPNLVWRSP